MNRYRLNQILEIFLFPFLDTELVHKDYLALCYQAYHDFVEESGKASSGIQRRNQLDKEYKAARQNLVAYLVDRNPGKVKSKDDVQMLCDFFYSMEDIEYEIQQIKGKMSGCSWEADIRSFYFGSLAKISRSLITYRDGVATIKQWVDERDKKSGKDVFSSSTVFNKIEIWNLICRIVVPDIFIAVAAVENYVGMEALYEQRANIALADKLLAKCLSKGVAENHLHFNAGFDYNVVWLPYVNLDFLEDTEWRIWDREKLVRLEMALFRYAAACFLEEHKSGQGFCRWLENLPYDIFDIIMKLYSGIYEGNPDMQIRGAVHNMRAAYVKRIKFSEHDYLLNEVYRKYVEYKTSSEFILLYQSYKYVRENSGDLFFAGAFLQYLRLKNEHFSNSLQNHVMQGLKYFQEFYNSSKRKAYELMSEEELMVEAFKSQARVSHLRKLEIRVAPWADVPESDTADYPSCGKRMIQQLKEQIYKLLYAYRRYILESVMGVAAAKKFLQDEKMGTVCFEDRQRVLEDAVRSNVNVPTLGIVFHFLKIENLEDRSGKYCWRKAVAEKRYSFSPKMLKRMYVTNVAIALEELRADIPKINEYIVGIDAASDENAMEPWMIAPAYKIVRSHTFTKPVMETENADERFSRIQNIGFTYHVGEDFRHIVSGLRHVDEVLEEFGYKAGDRLGHALVLGTDIEQWAKDNEVVPITLQEHLENLLWMWGTNTCYGFELPIQLEVLEDEIMNIAIGLYDSPETITVKMLYAAYRKKFAARHDDILEKMLEGENGMAPCMCSCVKGKSQCDDKWTADKLFATNYCPVLEEKYGKVELVPVLKEEIAVYKQLQEYLIQKMERRGIYIELNPTSNLTIGDFASMYQHPIFALNKAAEKSGHHVFVTINSDDPSVFNTNVENELAYIYYAAEAGGAAKSEILEWIDKIRQYGMDSSFIRQEKPTVQVLREVEEILQAIWKKK